MKVRLAFIILTSFYSLSTFAASEKEAPSPSAERAAVERVYHNHRLGQKQPLEQVLPAAAIEKLVRNETKKEAVLKKVYRIEITRAQVEEEVKRVDSTTRAPEILEEIKKALGNDPARFARAVARPVVVDRELRARFENDKEVHAPQRRAAEEVRAKLLKKQEVPGLREGAWQLSPRPESERPDTPRVPMPSSEGKSYSNSYSIEATSQLAQRPRPNFGIPDPRAEAKSYFEDLNPELQKVLRTQLRKTGDVSAVIETSSAFLVFLAKDRTAETLGVASLMIPKRSYEEWIAEQPDQ